jgi:dihydrolipoamide dehydrogenase
MKRHAVDVAIVGVGTAGMSAYTAARAHTDSIVVIESNAYGTTCARVGCMPSKLLIAAAEAAHRARAATLFGVHAESVRVDGEAVMARVRAERDRFVGFVLEAVERWPAAHRLCGPARFLDPHTLMVGDDTQVEAQRIVIATGTSPALPEGWREALGERLLVSDDVFDWTRLPESVAVAGAGAIGLELAQALARLGVRVRLFGRGGRLGPLTDPAALAAAHAAFGAEYALEPDVRIDTVARDGDAVRVRWSGQGGAHEERFACVLTATGRRPNLAGLDLARAGLPLDARGVPVHDRNTGRIGDSQVFIAGDVAQDRPLLHEAADDGRIAGDNAGRYPDIRSQRRRAALGIVFCEPQIAVAGESYRALCQRNAAFAAGEVSFADQGRSRVMAMNVGVLRVYGEHASGRFVGAEMVGPAAEHIGHLLAWAVHQDMTVDDMLACPYYHPVIEEGLRTALRELNKALMRGPDPVPRSMDCGPGA